MGSNEACSLDDCSLWACQDEGEEEEGIGKVLRGHADNNDGDGLVPGVAGGGADEGEGEGGGEDGAAGDGDV